MPTLVNSQSFTIQQLQKSIIQRTNYIGYPYVQYSIVFRIQILTSYTFSPRTSIYSRKAAVDSAFIYLLYRGRVGVKYRILYVVPLYAITAFFQYCFHLISTYLLIYIVDLHHTSGPLSSIIIIVLYQRSAKCYSSSYISYSLSTTYRQRAF